LFSTESESGGEIMRLPAQYRGISTMTLTLSAGLLGASRQKICLDHLCWFISIITLVTAHKEQWYLFTLNGKGQLEPRILRVLYFLYALHREGIIRLSSFPWLLELTKLLSAPYLSVSHTNFLFSKTMSNYYLV
jgi:hypothetical protein